MPWPRLSVILVFCDSWLFMMSSGILVFGIGLEYSDDVCIAAVYLCILFYSTSKLFVYAVLVEKVHIVWSPTVGVRRFESPVYVICLVSVCLYCIVITLMFAGPIHGTLDNGACFIGLKPLASIPLLAYDLYINLFLTFMFLYPLVRSKIINAGIRRLAVRTFLAAVIALSTSTINIVVLIVLKGRELGWVSLGACGVDIMVNATAIFWVSGSKSSHQKENSSGAHERGRRQGVAFSAANVDVNYPTSPGSIQLNQPMSPGSVGHFTPSASFPKSVNTGLESADQSDILTRSSWIRRMFERERPRKQTHLNISVTREFDLQTSEHELQACQLELQRLSDSEISHKIDA